MMNHLEIEWRHLDREGKTCDRCLDTGNSVHRAYETLARELKPKGWEVTLKETFLTEKEVPESNNILLNGIPLEQLIPGARKSENCCISCGELCGMLTLCRTIERDDQTYEAIPAAFILEAAYQLIHKQNR
jgi:hypothetical protein